MKSNKTDPWSDHQLEKKNLKIAKNSVISLSTASNVSQAFNETRIPTLVGLTNETIQMSINDLPTIPSDNKFMKIKEYLYHIGAADLCIDELSELSVRASLVSHQKFTVEIKHLKTPILLITVVNNTVSTQVVWKENDTLYYDNCGSSELFNVSDGLIYFYQIPLESNLIINAYFKNLMDPSPRRSNKLNLYPGIYIDNSSTTYPLVRDWTQPIKVIIDVISHSSDPVDVIAERIKNIYSNYIN